MITANDNGEEWCPLLSRIVHVDIARAAQTKDNGNIKEVYLLVEVPHHLVLMRNRHAFHVLGIANSFKIAADKEEVDFEPVLRFKLVDVAVYCIQHDSSLRLLPDTSWWMR